jgi:hypothetical protein
MTYLTCELVLVLDLILKPCAITSASPWFTASLIRETEKCEVYIQGNHSLVSEYTCKEFMEELRKHK